MSELYYIGENIYEFPADLPFKQWKKFLFTKIPYHFLSISTDEWTDADYEEYRNRMLRYTIIQHLIEKGEEHWSETDLKWRELARRGTNLNGVTGNPIERL